MTTINIRELQQNDEAKFLAAMNASLALHQPWIKTILTADEFQQFYQRCQQPNFKSYVLHNAANDILGVFNISDIAGGCFQSAYLGYYVIAEHANKGYMSQGLKLILKKVFTDLALHRIEANIQPENIRSIQLVRNNGFKQEGYSPRYLYINNQWRDHERWAITFEDWRS